MRAWGRPQDAEGVRGRCGCRAGHHLGDDGHAEPGADEEANTAYPGVETGTAGVAQGLEADRRCTSPRRPRAARGLQAAPVALTELGAALLLEPLPS
ncbi:hypothetical protein [Streptomyces sp. NPDC002078]